MQQAAFALFDFDKTLSRGDSIIPYLFYCIRRGVAPASQIFRAFHGVMRAYRHPERVSSAKSETLSFLQGRTQTEMDALARDFFRDRLCRRFFRQGRDELARLKAEGYRILVVSASPACYLHLLPEFLPVDAVISTPCGMDAEGVYTGKVGENCQGVDKPLRIAEYLAANHLTLDYDASRAYGDSRSDLSMLTLTASPTLVNPKRPLLRALPGAPVVRWK